jgi:hypothetical protein
LPSLQRRRHTVEEGERLVTKIEGCEAEEHTAVKYNEEEEEETTVIEKEEEETLLLLIALLSRRRGATRMRNSSLLLLNSLRRRWRSALLPSKMKRNWLSMRERERRRRSCHSPLFWRGGAPLRRRSVLLVTSTNRKRSRRSKPS